MVAEVRRGEEGASLPSLIAFRVRFDKRLSLCSRERERRKRDHIPLHHHPGFSAMGGRGKKREKRKDRKACAISTKKTNITSPPPAQERNESGRFFFLLPSLPEKKVGLTQVVEGE